MVPAITSFNFGLATNYTTPTIEPEPEQAVAYTVYHIGRVLEQITLGGPGVTIPPIFEAFPGLEVVRPIQPVQRHRQGVLKCFGPKEPRERNQQAAILLYALLPGEEGVRCSACKSHSGNGPFAQCISGGARWTKGACLCCYFTGTMSRCDLAHQHFLSLHRDMRERGQLAVAFPANAERQAQTDDLEIWRRMIEEEQERRLIKVAMAMNHKPS